MDLAEGRATGIPKILRAMRENGSPAPEFETDDDRTYFMIRLPIHPDASSPALEEGTDQVTEQVTPQVTPQVEKLLAALHGEMSRGELMARLGMKDRMYFRQGYPQPALSDELIQMTIPEKPNSRLQKYRLTAKGRGLRGKR